MDLLPNCFSLLDQTLYSNKDFQQLPEHTLGNNSWPCSLEKVHHRKSLSHILAEAASADIFMPTVERHSAGTAAKGTHATQSYRQLAQSTDLKQTRIHDSQTSVFVVIKCCSEAMLSADTAYQLSVLLLRNTWKNTYTLP